VCAHAVQGNPRMHTPATELSGEVLNTLSEEDRAAVQSVIAADQQAAGGAFMAAVHHSSSLPKNQTNRTS